MSRTGICKRLCMLYPPTKNALSIMPLTPRVFVNLSPSVRKQTKKEMKTGPGAPLSEKKTNSVELHLEKNMKGRGAHPRWNGASPGQSYALIKG